MEQTKTKKALIMSVLSVFLCIAMLIGMTFAWFTDTASTGVNKIQAGTLKVDIVNEAGTSIKGQNISFVNKDGADTILWEPGVTFRTTGFRIKNLGNLALKYKLSLNGVTGDNELLDVITFSVVKADGTVVDLDTFEGELKTKDATSEVLYIQGHMDENAGNEYQNKSIEGIGITVNATQLAAESDSFNNKYDENATYPKTVADIKTEYGTDGLNMPAGVEITDVGNGTTIGEGGTFTITLKDKEAFLYFTQVFDRQKAFEARQRVWGTEGFSKYLSEFNLASLNMWYGSYCNRITVKMGCDIDLNGATVKPFGFGGYAFYFDGNGHTIKNAKITASNPSSDEQVGFFGTKVNVKNVVFDNITVSAKGCGSAGVVAGSPNSIITDVTVKNSSVTGAKYTGAIAGYDYGDITNCIVKNTTVSGQYKVGGIVGYVCTDNAEQQRIITGNKLTDVTVKGEELWSGKTNFVIGKIVGNWNAAKGTCKDNTFSGTANADVAIGEIESGCSVTQ